MTNCTTADSLRSVNEELRAELRALARRVDDLRGSSDSSLTPIHFYGRKETGR